MLNGSYTFFIGSAIEIKRNKNIRKIRTVFYLVTFALNTKLKKKEKRRKTRERKLFLTLFLFFLNFFFCSFSFFESGLHSSSLYIQMCVVWFYNFFILLFFLPEFYLWKKLIIMVFLSPLRICL